MPCPICKKSPHQRYRPFCSARCADIDLGRWMTGAYTLPDTAEPETEEPSSQTIINKDQYF